MSEKVFGGEKFVAEGNGSSTCSGCHFLNDIEECVSFTTSTGADCTKKIWKKASVVEIKPEPVGKKDDSSKARYDLLPADALESLVQVITFGEGKYPSVVENGVEVPNWRKLDNFERRIFAAVQRHLWAHKRGEIIDPESGEPHLAHAASGIMFLLQKTIETKKENN